MNIWSQKWCKLPWLSSVVLEIFLTRYLVRFWFTSAISLLKTKPIEQLLQLFWLSTRLKIFYPTAVYYTFKKEMWLSHLYFCNKVNDRMASACTIHFSAFWVSTTLPSSGWEEKKKQMINLHLSWRTGKERVMYIFRNNSSDWNGLKL